MEVNRKLVDKLSVLARLHFSEDEKFAIQDDLQRMIHFVDKLNEIDTTGVEPLPYLSNAVNVLRTDTVKGSVARNEGLRNASDHDAAYFKVPKVIRQ